MDADDPLSTLEKAWAGVQASIVSQAPALLAAILILLLGWVLAVLARSVFARFAGVLRSGMRRLLGRPGAAERDYLPESVIRVAAALLFWLIMLIAIAVAAEVLGFAIVSAWLAALVQYVPTLIAGVLILVLGLLLARLARDLVLTGAWFGLSGQRVVLARLVYAIVAAVALILAMDQVGVRVSFLVIVLAVGLGAFIGGLLLAFALGAQHFVGDLIAAHALRQQYRAGQRIRVGEHEGVVVGVTQVNLLLQTAEGQLAIPARRLLAEPVMTLEARNV